MGYLVQIAVIWGHHDDNPLPRVRTAPYNFDFIKFQHSNFPSSSGLEIILPQQLVFSPLNFHLTLSE
jgi:hypothetical protein